MRWIIPFLLCSVAFAQSPTTITPTNTVLISNDDRPGVNMGGNAPFGQQQLLKSMNNSNGGYMPGSYYQISAFCSSGGTNDTTHWYYNAAAQSSSEAWPANFWVGATYYAYDNNTGHQLGTGTITASSANSTSTGLQFTLSNALTSACTPPYNEMIVKLTGAAVSLTPPQNVLPSICSTASWNTTDLDPASTNTIQSLQMPTGCTYQSGLDQPLPNATNTNSSLTGSIGWLNINGNYTFTVKAKCPVSTCSLNVNLARGGGVTYISNQTITPTVNTTPGAGWQTFTIAFSGTETQSGGNLLLDVTSTGTVLMQDVDVIEASTLSGNTTDYRDAVVYQLQQMHPGSIRFMDVGDWCSDVTDMIAPVGNARWCLGQTTNGIMKFNPNPPVRYASKLGLALLVGSDAWITVGQFNMPADWTTLINWLGNSANGPTSGVSWISAFASAGHKIYLEDGNEAWNSGAINSLYPGNGLIYGAILGPNMAAAKSATGYNSSVIKLVGNGFASQLNGGDGWNQLTLTTAQGTTNGLPDFIDSAAYMLGNLSNYTTSGSNVSATGSPWVDETAENQNWTQPSPPSGSISLQAGQAYAQTFGVNLAIYEHNFGNTSGTGATQLQLNQISSSVGTGLDTVELALKARALAGVPGPTNMFTMPQNNFNYNCNAGTCTSGVVVPLWGTMRTMGTGPGQTAGTANVGRPQAIAMQVVNQAIGSNNNLMSTTASGTPTFNYAGGQSGAGFQVYANSSVPYVWCTSYANSGLTTWTVICFNDNLTTANTVNIAGTYAPTGSVTQTIYPNSGNVITDNNENFFLGTGSISPVVNQPSSTSTSGTSYSIPADSMMALTYILSGSSSQPGQISVISPIF